MSTTSVYLSRSFVEFGPFSADEMKDFYSRGLLKEIDHIRLEGSDDWQHVVAWVNSIPATPAAESTPAAKAPAKKAAPAAKKAVAAKKAAASAKKAAKPKPKA